jgi:hypothetical protein
VLINYNLILTSLFLKNGRTSVSRFPLSLPVTVVLRNARDCVQWNCDRSTVTFSIVGSYMRSPFCIFLTHVKFAAFCVCPCNTHDARYNIIHRRSPDHSQFGRHSDAGVQIMCMETGAGRMHKSGLSGRLPVTDLYCKSETKADGCRHTVSQGCDHVIAQGIVDQSASVAEAHQS